MRISEIYRAFQGEGPFIGSESVFVRTHGCPVRCSWCDTPWTFDGSEKGEARDVGDILDQIRTFGEKPNIVVTGGEPLVQKDLGLLLEGLGDEDRTVEIETSGVLPPIRVSPHMGRFWNVSPKLPSAGPKHLPDLDVLARWRDELIECLRWKFVVADEADWQAMTALVEALEIEDWKVWVMPCAATRDALAHAQHWLLDRALGSGYKVTTRLHVLAYDTERASPDARG